MEGAQKRDAVFAILAPALGIVVAAVLVLWAVVGSLGPADPQGSEEEYEGPIVVLTTPWPMFRGGPSLRGVAGGSIGHTLRLKWRFTTGGRVVSSAAIADGRIYVGSDDGLRASIQAHRLQEDD